MIGTVGMDDGLVSSAPLTRRRHAAFRKTRVADLRRIASTSTATATKSARATRNWKVVFEEQRAPGTLRVWTEPFTTLRMLKLFDLRADPCERATSRRMPPTTGSSRSPILIFAAPTEVSKALATFKEYS